MHFGTFQLTTEGIDEPLHALDRARRERHVPAGASTRWVRRVVAAAAVMDAPVRAAFRAGPKSTTVAPRRRSDKGARNGDIIAHHAREHRHGDRTIKVKARHRGACPDAAEQRRRADASRARMPESRPAPVGDRPHSVSVPRELGERRRSGGPLGVDGGAQGARCASNSANSWMGRHRSPGGVTFPDPDPDP